MSLRFMSGLLTTAFLTLVVSINAIAYPSGSPAGYTGSPGDGQHCVSCHNGSAATVTGWITSNIPATGYIAGTIYNMSVTVSGSGKKGFEVSPQNATGTQLGILTAGTGNHLVGGTKYVTQNSSGSTSSTVTWNFTWTAPVAGTGTVTFYGAFTVGKSNTKLSTMVVSEDASVPLSATASATPTVICAGQTSQLDVSPAGGSGTYSYSWTSIPAGFTSLLKNPVVSPTITTQYIVHVSDGAFAVDAPANVTVNQPATAVAGNDTTFPFITTQVPLMGMAANYSTVLWTTSGSGTFSDANALSGNYLPSTADKTGGNVTLTLTASAQSPCTTAVVDTRNIHFDSPTGIDGVTNTALDLVLSPNPSTGLFSLRTHGFEPGSALVTISDLQGKIIVQKKMDATDNLPVQFNLSGTPAGLYLVKIQTSRVMLIRKLVIE